MMDAFHILNEDCWREIFGLLEPVELYNCSLVCERFDGILQDHKMEWMLGVVLPFLIPYLERRERNNNFVEGYPLKRMWNELNKIRLVCKKWRGAIDSYMSDDSGGFSGPAAHNDRVGDGFGELVWQEGPGWSRFTDNVQLAEFIEVFGGTGRNPFPGRKAIIYDLMKNQRERDGHEEIIVAAVRANELQRVQFEERRGEFLQTFGRFLWHVQIGWNQYRQKALSYQEDVVGDLTHLPHIRELTVGSAERLYRSEYNINERWERMDVTRLPELRDLKTLVFEMVPKGLGLALLTKYGPQLTRLEMMSKLSNVFFFEIEMNLMTSLRDFSITLLNTHFNQLFVVLRALPSQLEKLKLVLFLIQDMLRNRQEFVDVEIPYTNPPIFRIDQLFTAIGHLPLTTLTIETHQEGEISGLPIPDNLTIRTFNLKVKLYYPDFRPARISFDFLAKMISLTDFHLGIECFDEERTEMISSLSERVRVCEFIQDNALGLMYESNIWEVVPSLQTFSIDFDYLNELNPPRSSSKRIYTRREYQVVRDRMA